MGRDLNQGEVGKTENNGEDFKKPTVDKEKGVLERWQLLISEKKAARRQ